MAEDKNKDKKTEEKEVTEAKTTEKVETPNATNATQTSGAGSVPEDPYNEMEFEAFLELIGESNLLNWSIMAEALGVHRSTITRWKKTPQARQAIKTAIAQNLQEMEIAGKGDWKMYREKLKMLGIDDKQVVENINDRDSESLEKIADTLQAIYDEEDSKNEQSTKQDSGTRSTDTDSNKAESKED